MSEYKSKTKLVAIYRLEFYKTQKNWKLGTSDHDRGDSSKKHVDKTADLNATYSVERPADTDADSDPLNDAFIETESENFHNQPSTSRIREFSQQWLEPINIWPLGGSTDRDHTVHKPTNDQHQYTNEELLNKGEKCVSGTNFFEATPKRSATDRIQELVRLIRCQEENDMKEADVYAERYGCTDLDAAERAGDWTYCEAVPHKAMKPSSVWSAGVAENDGLDCRNNEDPEYCSCWRDDNNSEPARPLIQDLLAEWTEVPEREREQEQERERDREREEWEWEAEREREWEADSADASADSEGEFMRGAHAAPHSSQLDLSLPEELRLPALGGARLARLAGAQLLALADALRRLRRQLQQETERRWLLRNSFGRHSNSNAFPTRDAGPDPPFTPTPHTADRVLAGSHLARGVAGEEGCSGGLTRADLWGFTPHNVKFPSSSYL